MRGDDRQQDGMFSYLSPEARIPRDHPLRPIRAMVDAILRGMTTGESEISNLKSEISNLKSQTADLKFRPPAGDHEVRS